MLADVEERILGGLSRGLTIVERCEGLEQMLGLGGKRGAAAANLQERIRAIDDAAVEQGF